MALALGHVTFDCADAAELAAFWSALLDTPVDPGATKFFATVGKPGPGPALMFIQVPDKTPGKNVIHLDLLAPDWTDQIDRAVRLGAKHLADYDEYGATWSTLSDPEGNLFDIGKAV